jgi:hypothetical protein
MEKSIQIVEEWYTIDAETKMNEKIDKLQSMVNEQSQTIQILLDEIKHLKQEIHSSHHVSTNQNDRTHQLLEELKIIKQRELNMMIREKIPAPFHPIPSIIFTKRTTPSPNIRL